MIRIGVVNIDTSHPGGFGDVMARDGRMKFAGVYDDSFRGKEEIEGFIQRYQLEERCSSLEELADLCDIGFICGCDWDQHLRQAMPFIEKGKPVFLDKPMVGSVKDCRRVRDLVKSGARIIGASSARYALEIKEFLELPEEQRGDILTVYGTCGVDEFFYGIHIVEVIGGIMGTGAETVTYIGRSEQGGQFSESFCVRFQDGRNAIYTTQTGVWQRFALQILTTATTYQILIDPVSTYSALMEQIANYMEGKPHTLATEKELTESIEIILAAATSRREGGIPVRLCDLDENSVFFDGKAHWQKYRDASGAMYAITQR